MNKKVLFFVLLSVYSLNSYANSELERTVQAQGQLLAQYQQQITDLQYEVDLLRGQLQETTYQLNQTIERQKMILQQLAQVDTVSSDPKPTSTGVRATNTLVNWQPSGNDKDDYNFIIKFVLEGKESKEAISAFQQFLKDYPKSSYRDNVNYWLGQLSYNLGRKDDASFYFATVVKDFPKSGKAADSLYKIGLILLDKGEKAKAKAMFEQVIRQYPNDKNIVELANKKLTTLG